MDGEPVNAINFVLDNIVKAYNKLEEREAKYGRRAPELLPVFFGKGTKMDMSIDSTFWESLFYPYFMNNLQNCWHSLLTSANKRTITKAEQ